MRISITAAQDKATSWVMEAETSEEEKYLEQLFRGLPCPPFEVHFFGERGRKSRPATLRAHWLDGATPAESQVPK